MTVEDISCKCERKAVADGLVPGLGFLLLRLEDLGLVYEPSLPLRAHPGPELGCGCTTRMGRALLSLPRGSLRFLPAFYFGSTQASEHLKGRKVILFICLTKPCPSPHLPSWPPPGLVRTLLVLRSRFGRSRRALGCASAPFLGRTNPHRTTKPPTLPGMSTG